MTKEQFLNKWHFTGHNLILKDFEAVIATEIAKVQEQPQPIELKGNCSTFDGSRLVDQAQPELNPIEQAYNDGKILKFEHPIKQAFYYKIKIRHKSWIKEKWVQLYSATQCINENGILGNLDFIYSENFDNWEIYKEQDAEKITEHPKPKIKIGDRLINFNKGGSYGNVCKLLANCPFELYDENAKTYYTTYSLNGYELYTEPAEQTTKPFDKDRFEAMFRAVVASGEGNLWSSVFDITNQALKQLDAYYATKEGGNNE